ncbi:MAG TPA: hypothetical protein VGE07_01220, partial [Herpetosiphonaceae bacterium]
MSFGVFIGLILLAAAIAYVLRIGPARHWRRGDRLQRDWQRERQQLMESLQALQLPREGEPATGPGQAPTQTPTAPPAAPSPAQPAAPSAWDQAVAPPAPVAQEAAPSAWDQAV